MGLKKLALVALALVAPPLLAQVIDTTRVTQHDFSCVRLNADGTETIVSGHQRQDKAIASCINAEIADPSGEYHVSGGRWRIALDADALAQVYPGIGDTSPTAPEPNNPPVWNNTPSVSEPEGQSATYNLLNDVSDEDGDPLTCSLDAGSAALPTGVTLNSNCSLSFTPSTTAGTTTGVIVEASDGTDATDSPSFSVDITAVSAATETYPKLGLYAIGNWGVGMADETYWPNGLTSRAQDIAQVDVAIIGWWRIWSYDNEVTKDTSNLATFIKSFNPDVVLYAYTILWELNASGCCHWEFMRNKIESESGLGGNPVNDWYLRNPAGDNLTTFSNTWRVNHTEAVTPDANGLYWYEWYARFQHANSGDAGDWAYYGHGIRSEHDYDGVYNDVMRWEGKVSGADWDGDGQVDGKEDPDIVELNTIAHVGYIDEWLSLEPGFLTGGNYGVNCQDTPGEYPNVPERMKGVVNLTLFEWWMGRSFSIEEWGGWNLAMRSMKRCIEMSKGDPNHAMMHGVVDDHTEADGIDRYQMGRYFLASVLQDNAYAAIQLNQNERTFFMDEYQFDLGQPLEAADRTTSHSSGYEPEQNGVHWREFDNGIAIVNPKGNGTQTITLPSAGAGCQWNRLDAADYDNQRPGVNDGATNVTSQQLAERDGIILQRDCT